MQPSIVEISEIKSENYESENNESIEEKWRQHSNNLNIFWKMYVEATWDKSYDTLIQEEIHLQMCNIFHQEYELDMVIDELWKLMKRHYRWMYRKKSRLSTIWAIWMWMKMMKEKVMDNYKTKYGIHEYLIVEDIWWRGHNNFLPWDHLLWCKRIFFHQ